MELTIFDYIKDILFQKKKRFSNSHDDQLIFSSFMLQRWCSMSNKDVTLILNETTNRWLTSNISNQHFYKLLIEVLPKQKQKKVAYIKKSNNLSIEDDNIKNLSISHEISQRETKDLLKNLKIVQ